MPIQEIPPGQQIVGLVAETQVYYDRIPRLGFLIGEKEAYPKFESIIKFGVFEWTHQYPTEDYLRSTYYGSDYILSQIRYKNLNTSNKLAAMQLVFSNGLESPMFAVEGAPSDEVKILEIDTSRTIRYVSMSIHSDNSINGLRLLDEDQEVIATTASDEQWSDNRPIPEGKHIIGLRINTESNEINSLAFLLADLGA